MIASEMSTTASAWTTVWVAVLCFRSELRRKRKWMATGTFACCVLWLVVGRRGTSVSLWPTTVVSVDTLSATVPHRPLTPSFTRPVTVGDSFPHHPKHNIGRRLTRPLTSHERSAGHQPASSEMPNAHTAPDVDEHGRPRAYKVALESQQPAGDDAAPTGGLDVGEGFCGWEGEPDATSPMADSSARPPVGEAGGGGTSGVLSWTRPPTSPISPSSSPAPHGLEREREQRHSRSNQEQATGYDGVAHATSYE